MEQQDKRTVGQFLREAREAIGKSREEVAAATSIRPFFLAAMEEDDYRHMPDERYVLGFLAEYATFLGLDPDLVHRRFSQQIARRRESLAVFPPKRTIILSLRQLLPVLLLLLFLVPSIFIGLSLFGNRSKEPERAVPSVPVVEEPPLTPVATATETVVADPIVVVTPAEPNPSVSAEPSPPVPAEPTELTFPSELTVPSKPPPPVSSVPPGFRYTLEARALEMTWMLVTIDRQETKDVLLRPGEIWRWHARKGFLVTVGNAGGVALTLNGRPLPPLGEAGGVVRDLRIPAKRPSR